MTPQQEKQVEWLRKRLLETDGLNSLNYEFKKFDVKEFPSWGVVEVISCVGRKGDEGGIMEIFGRVRRHIFIGPKGGMKLANTGKLVGGEVKTARQKARGSRVAYALTSY